MNTVNKLKLALTKHARHKYIGGECVEIDVKHLEEAIQLLSPSENHIVYLDIDGVLADFEKGVEQQYSKRYIDFTKEERTDFWTNIGNVDFYELLEIIPEGLSLLEQLLNNNVNICLMTSTGSTVDHIKVGKKKLNWIYNTLHYNVPVCLVTPGTKHHHVGPTSILIDDRAIETNAWTQHGGIAYLFKESEENNNFIVQSILNTLGMNNEG